MARGKEAIDCLSNWKGRKIAVEAKKGFTKTNRGRALAQASERTTDGYARGGVAVRYPEGLVPGGQSPSPPHPPLRGRFLQNPRNRGA